MRLGRRAVATGAANLLVVRLDAARKVGMEDVAHVRLVDAHPEGDGRDDHHPGLGHEHVLVRLALGGVHPRVIGQRPHPGRREQRRRLLGLSPREAVHDAALAGVAGDEARELALPLALHLHREADVRPVEAEHELFDRAAEELLGDVAAGHLVGGRGQGRDGDPRKQLAQPAELRVLRPERRAPLRDAVRLVDGDQPQRQPRKRRQHPLGHQPLRRHVEQPRLARRRAAPGGRVVGPRVPRMDAVGGHACEPERRHLVPHQRDQRRDHHREPVHHQRRHLEAQRLARARGHHGQHVPAPEQRLDDHSLARAERLEPEHRGEHPARIGH